MCQVCSGAHLATLGTVDQSYGRGVDPIFRDFGLQWLGTPRVSDPPVGRWVGPIFRDIFLQWLGPPRASDSPVPCGHGLIVLFKSFINQSDICKNVLAQSQICMRRWSTENSTDS